MALCPAEHTEHVSRMLGAGLRCPAPATFLCVCVGLGLGVGGGEGRQRDMQRVQMAPQPTAHLLLAESRLALGCSAISFLSKEDEFGGQHSTHRTVSTSHAGYLPGGGDTQREALGTDHRGTPEGWGPGLPRGCSLLPCCLARRSAGNNGMASPVPTAPVSPCGWAVASNAILPGSAKPPCWELIQSRGSSGEEKFLSLTSAGDQTEGPAA